MLVFSILKKELVIMPVENGNTVKVEYIGSLEDGTVFDSSEGKEPLEFKVGEGKVIKGFENAVLGMDKGQEKEATLQPAEAYGQPNPTLVKVVPRDQLPKEPEPKEGMMLMLKSPEGQQFPAKITKVTDNEVSIDLNPPLAGKVLKFKIKVVDIS